MKEFNNINSNLEALKLKKLEEFIYSNADEDIIIIPKVIPFKGINTDMMLIKNSKVLFVKCMDTTEEIFSFLDEEILQVMMEENETLAEKMKKTYPEISYNYVFLMPYIEYIDDCYGMADFVNNHVICGEECYSIFRNGDILESNLKRENDEIFLSMFIQHTCPEYFTVTDNLNTSDKFKIINYSDSKYSYRFAMLENEQIRDINSIVYGNHAILGGSGTGKSTTLLGRVIKLSKIYPHHNFLLLTFTKQQCNKYNELLDILGVDKSNIIVSTYNSFIFRVAKANNLIIDYNMLKQKYDKVFANIMKQIDNTVKEKSMFKGIFIDEAENFNEEQVLLIHKFLYFRKHIFNIANCKSYNINNSLNIYKCRLKAVDYEDELILRKNYRIKSNTNRFINDFVKNANLYLDSITEDMVIDVFDETESVVEGGNDVNILRVDDIDDQINSVIWEVQHLINDLGYSPEDIAVVYPFNKKKLKTGKILYFQYMLRKALDDAKIGYIYADETVTDITPKPGITISNIYSVKSLSYKAIVICELEMLYNQTVSADSQAYHINDFVGDLNKVYVAMTRAEEYISIVVSYTDENSDIIKVLCC